MNKYFYAVFMLLFTTQLFAQGFDPKILILSPAATKHDKSLEKELAQQEKQIKKYYTEEAYDPDEHKNRPENVQLIYKSESDYQKNLTFFKMTSYVSEQHLLNIFYQRFKNVLILLKDEKSSGEKSDLKRIAEEMQMQFVVNFKSIELYKEKKSSFAKITIQLYDQETGEILLDKSYTGDSENPGFEFACEEGKINCCINNALAQGLNDVIKLIAANNPTLKREKQLAGDRTDILLELYYQGKPDKALLATIIPASDKMIKQESVYFTLFNDDKTKFVAFFAEPVSSDGKAFMDAKNDNRKNILSNNQMDIFNGKYPNTYAHMVSGVKYNGKWYYEKMEVTYFDANSISDARKEYFVKIQKWDFFKENSTVQNPEFWETKIFGKVADLTKDPDWEKYGADRWEAREKNDRPYIGMYEIVSNQMKSEREAHDESMEEALHKKYVLPQVVKLKLQKKYESIVSSEVMIYPTDEKTFICPLKINETGKQKSIFYLVLIKQNDETYKVYEWNYLKQDDFAAQKNSEIIEQINTLTSWDYGYDRLDDEKFWKEYVLSKSGNDYKYLKELK